MITVLVPEWMGDALCAQVDTELFFPEKGASSREARKVCKSCPVRKECLEFSVKTGQRFGVWGGQSERERRKIKRSA
jgi:WhiB family redox-sensing transcriptional regulator